MLLLPFLIDVDDLNIPEEVPTEDLNIFGPQQIVRAVISAFKQDLPMSVYEECYTLATYENIDHKDYQGFTRITIDLLLSQAYNKLIFFLTINDISHKIRQWFAVKLGQVSWIFNFYMYIKKLRRYGR